MYFWKNQKFDYDVESVILFWSLNIVHNVPKNALLKT